MKGWAVVFTDRIKVEVLEVELPEPGVDDVVVEVDYSWISTGTESSYLRGERVAGEEAYAPGKPWPFPIVAGYQKTGTVVAVGSQVSGLAPGDRVFVSMSKVKGMFSPMGGHVNPAVTPQKNVIKLPAGEPPASVAYSGLVLTQVGVNCGTRPPLAEGAAALVIGDGLVGQWTAQTLVHRQARTAVAGRHSDRLDRLPPTVERLAPPTKANPADLVAKVKALFPAGLDAIVDTVGDMGAVHSLLPLIKRNGHLVSAGFLGEAGHIDIQQLRRRETTLHAPSGWHPERMALTLGGIRDGWLQTESLITHRFPVSRASEAWDMIIRRSEPFLGVVLDWRGNGQ
ncbi:MAG: L-idonate 5-dehydrogenase [Paenibacillaceae bacterium]|jgi:2-desacetyl-2-hydroxyethyl bacteriochlorophyllide A dehydrogenase|nr:L-idonate 5-dehydrogenase [Paenibacillaceae bacterium]